LNAQAGICHPSINGVGKIHLHRIGSACYDYVVIVLSAFHVTNVGTFETMVREMEGDSKDKDAETGEI
jgi:hypothetical protein